MTDYTDEEYELDEVDIEDLMYLPYYQVIAPQVEQFNTSEWNEAELVVENAAGDLARVSFHIHDADSNLMYSIAMNEGHSPGMRADYLTDIMQGDRATLEEELRAMAGSSGASIGEIDWIQVTVYHI